MGLGERREGMMILVLKAMDEGRPITEAGGSDSAAFDNGLELLTVNGVLSLEEAVMLLAHRICIR